MTKKRTTTKQQPRERLRAATCSRRRLIFPSIYDDKLKDRCRGYIVDLNAKGDKTLVMVYGDSMEEMRELKHHLAEAVRTFYANAKHIHPEPTPKGDTDQ